MRVFRRIVTNAGAAPGYNRTRDGREIRHVAKAPATVVVDDEAYQRRVLAEFLAGNGLRPTAVASGADLKRLAQQSMPDVALLDLHLGEPENGFDQPICSKSSQLSPST
jgi:ActR/RegA family two-component response regulator